LGIILIILNGGVGGWGFDIICVLVVFGIVGENRKIE
jgi:hypothetical protein